MPRITAFTVLILLLLSQSFLTADKEDSALIHLKQGEEYFQNQEYEKSVKEFKASVNADPGLLKGWENLGWAYWKLDKVEESIKVWKNVLEITPDDVRMLNALAKAYTAKGNFDQALLLYDQSLQKDSAQKDVKFYRARLLGWNKHRAEAVEELQKLLEADKDNDNDKVRFQLAKFLSEENKHGEALPYWQDLVRKYPDELKYKLEYYKSLYLLEKYEEASRVLQDILRIDSENIRALEFLADDAVYCGHYDEAGETLRKIISKDPTHVKSLNKLLKISFDSEDYASAIQAARKSLRVNGNQISIRLLYADALRLNEDLSNALTQYKKILSINPNNFPAHVGLKELYMQERDYDNALKQIDWLLEKDTSNFYLMIDKAEVWAYQKRFDDAILLLRGLEKNALDHPAVFALLYHGLTPLERSDIPKLSHFREQMQVLKNMGYEAVTTEDMALAWSGKKELPEKTVLITFDDGRKDSFEFADPVLKELNYKAVMFVPISIIDHKNPFFSSWEEIREYQKSGRWLIQAHGYFSHEPIQISETEEGWFLPNKMWLPEQRRMENDNEFRERIDEDYRYAKEKLEKLADTHVNAFTYPEGNLGQEEFSNNTSAFSDNLSTVPKYFQTAYIQNQFGFNLVGDYPYLLKRIEIPRTWTAEKFQQHILFQRPLWKVRILLAEVLRWSGHLDESAKRYEILEKEFPGQQSILLHQGTLFMQANDYQKAEQMFEDVLHLDPGNEEAKRKLHEIEGALSPNFESSLTYFEDSNDRDLFQWANSGEFFLKGGQWSVEPSYALAFLKEKGVEDIDEDKFGLAGNYRHKEQLFRISYAYRAYSDVDDAHNYGLEYFTPLSFIDRIYLMHFYENIETARAVTHEIKDFRYGIGLDKKLPHDLSLNGKYQFFDYNDDNERNSLRLGLFYQFHKEPDFWIGYEFDYEDTSFDSPDYYAPENLMIHQARIRTRGKILSSKLSYDLSYALGRASEENVDDRWVNSVIASSEYAFSGDIGLFVVYQFSKTPSYDSQYVQGGVRVHF